MVPMSPSDPKPSQWYHGGSDRFDAGKWHQDIDQTDQSEHESSGNEEMPEAFITPAAIGRMINEMQRNNQQKEVLQVYRAAFGANVSLNDDDVLVALNDMVRGDTITVGRGSIINNETYNLIKLEKIMQECSFEFATNKAFSGIFQLRTPATRWSIMVIVFPNMPTHQNT